MIFPTGIWSEASGVFQESVVDWSDTFTKEHLDRAAMRTPPRCMRTTVEMHALQFSRRLEAVLLFWFTTS